MEAPTQFFDGGAQSFLFLVETPTQVLLVEAPTNFFRWRRPITFYGGDTHSVFRWRRPLSFSMEAPNHFFSVETPSHCFWWRRPLSLEAPTQFFDEGSQSFFFGGAA